MKITLRFKSVLFVFILTAITTVSHEAQSRLSPSSIKVPLKLDTLGKSFRFDRLFCDKNYDCGLFPSESEKSGFLLRDSVPVGVARSGNGFELLIEGKRLLLKPSSSIVAKLRIGTAILPFEIAHRREEEKGSVFDSFTVNAHYLATGIIRAGKCNVKIALNDLDLNGKFDLLDVQGGSNLQMDVNNDGKFWGREEFRRSNEIIELCGESYLVSSITNSSIVFQRTNLKLAKIGSTVPEFVIKLIDGTIVTSEKQKGRALVLDFWASWCAPCVANLPKILKLKDDLKDKADVISVNVDSATKRTVAERIIQQNMLQKFSTIRGQGNNDPLWKTFGGANLNRLAIPLYVLIDRNGVVQYAAGGGEDLKELRAAITQGFGN